MAILIPSEKAIYFPSVTQTNTDELTGLCTLAQSYCQSDLGAGRFLEAKEYVEVVNAHPSLLKYWPILSIDEVLGRETEYNNWQLLNATTGYVEDSIGVGTRIIPRSSKYLDLKVTYAAGWVCSPGSSDRDVQFIKSVCGQVVTHLAKTDRLVVLSEATQTEAADTQVDHDRADRLLPGILRQLKRYAANG